MPKARRRVVDTENNEGDQRSTHHSQETGPPSISVSAKNCAVCFSLYDGNEKRPRMLPCGHTFCTQCISKNFDGLEVSCPTCRGTHQASSPSDFAVNFDLESLMQEYTSGASFMAETAMTQLTTEPQDMSKWLRTLRINLVNYMENLTATSKDLSSQLEQYIEELENWKGEHQDFAAQSDDMVKRISKESKRVKDAIDEELIERKKTEMALKPLQSASTRSEILQSVENGSLCSVELERWVEESKENFPNALLICQSKDLRGRYKPGPLKQFSAQDTEGTQNSSSSASPEMDSAVTSQSRVESGSGRLYPTIQERTHAAIEGIPPWQRNQDVQTELRDTVFNILNQSTSALEILKFLHARAKARGSLDSRPSNESLSNVTNVLAVKEVGRKEKWYAKIRIDGRKRVLLSALRRHEGLVSESGCVLLKHNDVMTMVESKSRRVFLELGVEGHSLGSLIISLIDECYYSSNFLHLCIGDKGHSFIGSKILRACNVDLYGEYVTTGDYDLNDGQGGQAVVSGVEWEEEFRRMIYNRPLFLKGRVEACSNSGARASQFIIKTGSFDLCPSPTFGRVEEGLDILKKAVREYSDITQVEVIDCGVILQQYDFPWWIFVILLFPVFVVLCMISWAVFDYVMNLPAIACYDIWRIRKELYNMVVRCERGNRDLTLSEILKLLKSVFSER